ncbi:bromodomain-containing protein 3-like [Drosophila subobscura]|uniref:bromodomain-containing protein 3-like n=1 Tax=Drosophila subobscura TaxID=7241 RepID=UPI00155ADAA3|nr:bromodomain-containing protein 3-like [Drosophila subobscura]
MDACKNIIEVMLNKEHVAYAWPFYKPFDADIVDLTDYHDKIKKPMDLGTIRLKMEDGHYSSVLDFANDVRLVFSNCYKYYHPRTDFVGMAQKLQHVFEVLFAEIRDEPVPNVVHDTHTQDNMHHGESDLHDDYAKIKVLESKLDMTFSTINTLVENKRKLKAIKRSIDEQKLVLKNEISDLKAELKRLQAVSKADERRRRQRLSNLLGQMDLNPSEESSSSFEGDV